MKRRAAVLALALSVTIPAATAATAAAKAQSHGAAVSAAAHAKNKGKAHKPPLKPVRKAVVYAGTLTAVDSGASTLTLAVTGGNDKSVRGTSLTITVPTSARVLCDDHAATLADLTVGDSVNVKAARTGTVTIVVRVSAQSTEPDTDPTPEPTSTPTPEPGDND
jgi:hypothetical protein